MSLIEADIFLCKLFLDRCPKIKETKDLVDPLRLRGIRIQIHHKPGRPRLAGEISVVYGLPHGDKKNYHPTLTDCVTWTNDGSIRPHPNQHIVGEETKDTLLRLANSVCTGVFHSFTHDARGQVDGIWAGFGNFAEKMTFSDGQQSTGASLKTVAQPERDYWSTDIRYDCAVNWPL